MIRQPTAVPVTTYETILGQVLRDAREASGLSQTELARRVGVAQPYWSRVEQGRANPSIGVLRRAGAQLELSYGELAGRADRVCGAAEARGVQVLTRRETEGGGWLPLLGVAAISDLVGSVLAGKDK